ncbi:hypothetical protein [Corynebacterium epidermidicanis]|uniref:Uncharacterized protein n=1 Tax=Corynebacterium epidermidicanis TaxID=1050174 RepID=A0A0G3GR01_9CORY|nr:hypothetical protein [Corynebacterium epidermidicanis]AKK03005.1 hypothetical protein CEPID_05700 [Corynebacterium epidermidicanis]
MMTTDKSGQLDPQFAAFKKDMFMLSTGVANAANRIGIAHPAWGPDITGPVNKILDPAVSNVARLPDELARAIMQVAAAHPNQIGQLMHSEFTTPATVAPLARTAIENIALLLYINRDEDKPEEHTVRAARAIRCGMNRDKVHTIKGLDELYGGLNTVLQRYTKKHTIPELKHDEVGYDKLVKQTLGELVGEGFYEVLCSYTHHNAWRAYYQFLAVSTNPTDLELDSLLFAYRTSIAVAVGAKMLSQYRDAIETRELTDYLIDAVERMQALGRRIDAFQDELRERAEKLHFSPPHRGA